MKGADDAAEQARKVGAMLREGRERKGLTVEMVGSALKFAPRQVLAVEEGRTGDLPPGPYVRGLVVAYAALLDLDPDAAARACAPTLAEAEGGGRSVFRYPERKRANWRDWAIPMACACGIAAYLGVSFSIQPARVALPEPMVAPVEPRSSAQSPEPQDEGPPPPAPAPAATLGVRVLLRSEGSTWVEVAVDGGKTQRQELRPGQNLELVAPARLDLALGDAGVVRVKVNERDLGFIGNKGEIKAGLTFAAPRAPGAPGAPSRAARSE